MSTELTSIGELASFEATITNGLASPDYSIPSKPPKNSAVAFSGIATSLRDVGTTWSCIKTAPVRAGVSLCDHVVAGFVHPSMMVKPHA